MVDHSIRGHRQVGIRRRAAAAAVGGLLLLNGCGDPAPEVVEPEAPASPTTSEAPATTEEESPTTGEESPTTSEQESPTSAGQPSADPDAQGPDPSDADQVTNLALCGDDTYDTVDDRCPQMSSDFTTSALHCTADAQIDQAGPLEVRFYRDGGLAFQVGADIPEASVGNQVPLYADINVGRLELPQGTWVCELVLPGDTRETGETTVQGPGERFSQGSACNNSAVFEEGPVTHCLQDAGTLAPSTPEIGCSGVVTDVLDKEIEIRAEWENEESTGWRTLGTLDSPGGVLVAHGSMTSQGLLDEPEFPPGDYRCVVLVEGDEIGGHDFTVG
jgi:hypothetical protein